MQDEADLQLQRAENAFNAAHKRYYDRAMGVQKQNAVELVRMCEKELDSYDEKAAEEVEQLEKDSASLAPKRAKH